MMRDGKAYLNLFIVATAIVACDPAFSDNVRGAWLSPELDNWPLVAVHAALTPDGRVLTFGSNADGNATGYFFYDVWDPNVGLSSGHVTIQNNTLTDIFCSYAAIIPDSGNILISGGTNWTGSGIDTLGNRGSTIFNSTNAELSRESDMIRARYYATSTPLMNGEIYIQGGKGGPGSPEVRDVNGNFRLLSGASTTAYSWNYPRNFLAPDGRVFGFDVKGLMYFVDPVGNGSITSAGELGLTNASVVSTAAMFQPGKILQVVGKNRSVFVIDINGPQPVVTATNSLPIHRTWANATVLPNGRVLVTGGSGVANQLVDVSTQADIWDPQTGEWTFGASGSRPRLYHSIALLLPDASVLVAGGGANEDAPVNNFHAEIYYPPYLFGASGGFANRPSINSAPETLTIGETFMLQSGSSSIQRVTLVQAGAATHSTNLQQRFVELSFVANGETLYVEMPERETDTPPGYYLLFVLDDNGVPSKAKIVRVALAPDEPDDTIAPSKPTNFHLSKVNGNPNLTWAPSTDNVGVAGYAIYRSTNGTLGPEFARTQSTTWTDVSAQEGTTYTYAVRAYDAAENLSPSSGRLTKTAFQNPTKPGSFSLTLSNYDPRLNFSPSSDNVGVVGYNVYRSTNGTLGPLFAQIPGAPWIDTSAQTGVRYTYAVRARDAAGYLSAATTLKSITAQ